MSEVSDLLKQIDNIIQDSWEDAGRSERGSNAAGSRLRKRMSKIKQLIKDIRLISLAIRDRKKYKG